VDVVTNGPIHPPADEAEALVELPNSRDLGDRRTASGLLLRTGIVVRSAAPADPVFIPHMERLGITQVYDLRTPPERELRPDHLPATARQEHIDLLADQPEAGPASLGRIARLALDGDTRALRADDLDAAFVATYRAFVTMPSARAAARRVLSHVADSDDGTILLHCTVGKDRTGWLAALILLALDVAWDDVMADYLVSGPAVIALFAPYADEFANRGGDLEAMMRAINAYPHYLEASRQELREQFGSLDRYLCEGLDLPPDFRDRLARRFLA
jgi:protein-tyrosine phosphatase